MRESKILKGMRAAVAHARGETKAARVTIVRMPDVKAIRLGLNMSQEEFARKFGFSLATLRGWEQKRRHPDGPARVLLTVIAREPKAVRELSLPRSRIGSTAWGFRHSRQTAHDARITSRRATPIQP